MTAPTTTDLPQPVMRASGLVKNYGRVVALDHANLELYPGEVLGVIGDNGAGKSTLIKCFSGAVIPDEGEIRLDGEQRPLHSRPATLRPPASRPSTRRSRSARPWTSPPTCTSVASDASRASRGGLPHARPGWHARGCTQGGCSATWTAHHPGHEPGRGDAFGRPAPGRGRGHGPPHSASAWSSWTSRRRRSA